MQGGIISFKITQVTKGRCGAWHVQSKKSFSSWKQTMEHSPEERSHVGAETWGHRKGPSVFPVNAGMFRFSFAKFVLSDASVVYFVGDVVLQQHLVPGGSGHGDNVQQVFLLDFPDLGEEVVGVVGRETWVDNGPVLLYMPLIECFVENISSECWVDSRLHE